MKKNYVKPSLQTELFAVESIMSEAVDKPEVSAVLNGLTVLGANLDGIQLTGDQLQTINFGDFNL